MADVVSPQKRSEMMAGIRAKNTKPELLIRRALHGRGFRYRLHASDLPGKPDIILHRYKTVIMVHGCFWHGHECHLFKWPSTRVEFWRTKIQGNRKRDTGVRDKLEELGWKTIIVWECAVRGKKPDVEKVIDQICHSLETSDTIHEIKGRVSGEVQ